MPDKDPAISKLVKFGQTFWKNFLLVLTIAFECLINFCELVIKVVVSVFLLAVVFYIFALLMGYAVPPDWFSLPHFNIVVL